MCKLRITKPRETYPPAEEPHTGAHGDEDTPSTPRLGAGRHPQPSLGQTAVAASWVTSPFVCEGVS